MKIDLKRQHKLEVLAQALNKDLNTQGLIRYLNEQYRMIVNETNMGRSSKRYEFYRDAAILALKRENLIKKLKSKHSFLTKQESDELGPLTNIDLAPISGDSFIDELLTKN